MAASDSPQTQVSHFSMLRNYHAADFITPANAFAGTASILAMMSYLVTPESRRVTLALGLLPVALVCDIADGYIARRRHAHSVFGREPDSLADIVADATYPQTITNWLFLVDENHPRMSRESAGSQSSHGYTPTTV